LTYKRLPSYILFVCHCHVFRCRPRLIVAYCALISHLFCMFLISLYLLRCKLLPIELKRAVPSPHLRLVEVVWFGSVLVLRETATLPSVLMGRDRCWKQVPALIKMGWCVFSLLSPHRHCMTFRDTTGFRLYAREPADYSCRSRGGSGLRRREKGGGCARQRNFYFVAFVHVRFGFLPSHVLPCFAIPCHFVPFRAISCHVPSPRAWNQSNHSIIAS